MSILSSALDYAKNGLSVIPVGRDKKPLVPWAEFQKRRATEKEILRWFELWPDANLGLVTGEISGITVVDIEKGGDVSYLPQTTIQKTGGGGYHYLYKYQPGVKNGARVKDLTDIRGEGGYIVIAPSIHQSGNPYEWVRTDIMAPFPMNLFPELMPKVGAARDQDWADLMSGAAKGSRADSATKVCGKLMHGTKAEDWELVVWPALQGWNQKNDPPLTEKQLREIFESIGRKEYGNRSAPSAGASTVSNPSAIGKVKWSEALEMGTKELAETKPEDCISYGYSFLDDALTGIFHSELILIGGITGTGKSAFAMNIVYKNALKGHKAFVFALEDRLEDYAIRALFFKLNQIAEAEGDKPYSWNLYRRNCFSGDKDFTRRLQAAKDAIKSDNITFAKVDGRLDFGALSALIDEEAANGTELFLIDHLHYLDLDSPDMNRAEFIENIIVNLRTLQRRNKARILLIAHYRKTNGEIPSIDSFKDSISIGQNASYMINLWRDRGENMGAKKGSSMAEALTQFKNSQSDNFVQTWFLIPKARNPNGEVTIIAKWDKKKGDYVDKVAQEPRPLQDMPKTMPSRPKAIDW